MSITARDEIVKVNSRVLIKPRYDEIRKCIQYHGSHLGVFEHGEH